MTRIALCQYQLKELQFVLCCLIFSKDPLSFFAEVPVARRCFDAFGAFFDVLFQLAFLDVHVFELPEQILWHQRGMLPWCDINATSHFAESQEGCFDRIFCSSSARRRTMSSRFSRFISLHAGITTDIAVLAS